MKLRPIAATIFASLLAAGPVGAVTTDELLLRLEQLEAQNQELRTILLNQKKGIEENRNAVTVVADSVETTGALGSKVSASSFGGYGELHYNNLKGDGGASDKEQMDLHRFVLFFGHEFSQDIRFFSEVEIEHNLAGEGKPGEVEVEQAYVEFDINDQLMARAGVFMVPVGIINETHEPPTFYGTERNPVEKNIIPATWWEGGAGLSGHTVSGFGYDIAVHTGLNVSSDSKYAVRKGRQKTAKATAENLAATARVKYTGMPGLELAATLQYQDDITQGQDALAGSAYLFETHAVWSQGDFALKALYAMWNLDGDGPELMGADEQVGWYLEPSFKLSEQIGLFARYNQWDNQAGLSGNSEKTQWDLGVNWWPHPDVVIKADYQNQDNDNGKDQNGFNVGVGYQF